MLALLLLAMMPAAPEPAIMRAVAYLSKEVPRWKVENHCYSCHNNGDAARALYAARRAGYKVPADSLADTTDWITHPARWEDNPGTPALGAPAFGDKNLARIQFAAALADSAPPRAALLEAAQTLLANQLHDGSWKVDAAGTVGSPATYGTALATLLARRTLDAAAESPAAQPGAARDSAAATRLLAASARANRWFFAFAEGHPAATIDRAAVVMALPTASDAARAALVAAQNPDGGWGPYPHAPSEVFDTAVAMIALRGDPSVAKARAWLLKQQQEGGDWIETTRPSGAQSYAEHISTTAWALLALLATTSR